MGEACLAATRAKLEKICEQIRKKENEISELESDKKNLMTITTVLYKQQHAWNGKEWDVSQIGKWKYGELPQPCPQCKKTMGNENARYLKVCSNCYYPNPNYGNGSLSKMVCGVCGATEWDFNTIGLCPSMTYGTCKHCGNHVFVTGG